MLQTCCKRLARIILLVYYPELSPNTDELVIWANNQVLLPLGIRKNREELLVPYRKAIIADLTGIEGQKRKAKFIYDLNKVRVRALG